MLLILLRTLILYLVALFALRLMGKAELSEMEPFQLVILLMIAELAAMPMADPGFSLINGVVAVLGIMFFQVLISFISYRSEWFRIFFNGKSKVLIKKGVIDEDALKDLRINISDLLEQLRIKNFPSVADVDYAILETNGELSVIPKPAKKPLTRKDLKIFAAQETMPLPLIVNGHLYNNMLTQLNMTEDIFKSELLKHKVTSYNQVLLCFSDENRKIVVHKKGDSNKMEV